MASNRSIRHAWLTDLIIGVHAASRDVRRATGSRGTHARLRSERGTQRGGDADASAELKGLPGSRRRRPRHDTPTATDLVDRQFARDAPNQLWVTDITEHPTREGKVYCAVVLDAHSRTVVGWSIDSNQTATLVTNALGMAIQNRTPPPGTIIHSDHGTQTGLNRSSQHRLVGASVGVRRRLLPVSSIRGSCVAGR